MAEAPAITIRRRRGDNGNGTPRTTFTALALEHEEMAALDDLGPRTRRAICESPLNFLAVTIVSQIIEINDKIEAENEQRQKRGEPLRPYVDPKNPDLDQRLAIGVVESGFTAIANDEELGDRALECARMGIKTLVARPTARTARERRKTEGRRFRGW